MNTALFSERYYCLFAAPLVIQVCFGANNHAENFQNVCTCALELIIPHVFSAH